MMEQVCGYLGAEGKFYREEYDAALSIRVQELKAEIRQIEIKIQNVKQRLREFLLRRKDPHPSDYSYPAYVQPTEVIERITEYPIVVLQCAEDTLALLESKNKLETELERISDEQAPKQGYMVALYYSLKGFFSKK